MIEDNYTIAVCDILGFRKVVASTPLSHVVERYQGWLRKALAHSLYKNEFPSQIPSMSQLVNHQEIGVAWFSDTVLLYTLEDKDHNVNSLFEILGWFIFESMLAGRTIRCGVAYGPAYIDSSESSYVGPVIIEAYDLEQKQAWSGGAVSPSAIDRIPQVARGGDLFEWWVIPYKVPGKSGTVVSNLAINWTQGIHTPTFEILWSESSSEPRPADWVKDFAVAEKWWNTKLFHDTVCRFCSSKK